MGASKTKEVKAEASSAQSKKGMFLRERDIDLLSYVAAARFLSTRQIQQLVFPDGAIQNVDARLLQLGPGRDTEKAALRGAALLQAVPFSRLNGVRVRAWGITQRGARETEARLGYSAEVMNNSVGEAFRNQAVVTNELFVQLLQVGPCNPRIVKFREGSVRGGGLHSPSNYFAENLRCFRWTPLGQARLHWTELKPGAPEERFIEPDAILEVPKAKRRFFIEQEVGGLDVVDEKRTVESVAVRLQRYATFLTEFADSDRKLTHVRAQYPDRFTPEVVFIAPSPRRRDELRADVELWKTRNPTMHFAIRCQIVSEAAQDLGQLIYGAALRAPAAAALARGEAVPVPTVAKEKRGGRVSKSTPPGELGLDQVLLELEVSKLKIEQQAKDLARIRNERGEAQEQVSKLREDLERIRKERQLSRELLLHLVPVAAPNGANKTAYSDALFYLSKVGLLKLPGE